MGVGDDSGGVAKRFCPPIPRLRLGANAFGGYCGATLHIHAWGDPADCLDGVSTGLVCNFQGRVRYVVALHKHMGGKGKRSGSIPKKGQHAVAMPPLFRILANPAVFSQLNDQLCK